MDQIESSSSHLHKTTHIIEKVPESEIDGEFKPMLSTITTLLNLNQTIIKIEEVPLFRDAPKGKLKEVFAAKCKECSKICDFSSNSKDEQAKKDKKLHLQDFSRFMSNPRNTIQIDSEGINLFLNMVIKNIRRPFPMIKKASVDCGDQVCDAAWPHLQLIYESLLNFFQNPGQEDITISHPTIVSSLIHCSCSPDERERMAVRDVLKAFYSNFHHSRSQIIRIAKCHFRTASCSAELLEVFIRVIDAFKTPLSPQHKSFYLDAILFLHTANNFVQFCLPLFQCVNHYIILDNSLFKPTIYFIYKHWPESNVKKQILFFSEIEGLIINFSKIVDKISAQYIFRIIADAVQQPNLELSETAMNVILGVAIEKIIHQFIDDAEITLVPVLYKTGKKHWNEAIREDAVDVIDHLSQIDQNAFDKAKEEISNEKKKLLIEKENNTKKWSKIFVKAKKNDSSINEVVTIY